MAKVKAKGKPKKKVEKVKLSRFHKMLSKDLHKALKRKKLWFKNAQFLFNKEKIAILEENDVKGSRYKKIKRNLKKRMVEVRITQGKNISKAKKANKNRVKHDLPDDTETVDEVENKIRNKKKVQGEKKDGSKKVAKKKKKTEKKIKGSKKPKAKKSKKKSEVDGTNDDLNDDIDDGFGFVDI